MAELVKYEQPKSAEQQREEKIAAYWALFCLQNANPEPDVDGSYYLGTITNPAQKTWTKVTPYSVARKEIE